jgi:hypothetical protein
VDLLRRAGDTVHGVARAFLKEHAWGFGTKRSGEPTCYRVEHAVWRTSPTVEHALDVDFGMLYGDPFAILNDAAPLSVIAAEGSAVAVYPAEPLGAR